ncbi:phosphopantetheine-binding protein [Streptomyces sp. NPDC094468]|uniref:phosphopantetheine-binding protein n=1 Tax=Streptomyces sp. NPDC094468 TaxID=3366066 RepID=UPI003822E0E4
MNLRYQEAPDRVAALTEIWRKVLRNPDLDENSDLFENDGTSLHVLQITGEIHSSLAVDVKLRDVFFHSSPRSLSDFLEVQQGSEK